MILVAYATRCGSIQEVAEAVVATLRESGLEVDIQPPRKVRALASYRAVVIGAPIYIGSLHKDAQRFSSRHGETLSERPVAVFGLGPTRDDEKERQGVRVQLDKELEVPRAYTSRLRSVWRQVQPRFLAGAFQAASQA